MSPFVDLRSDTITQPTPEMRAAMAQAAVGDDVYGEDPTVNALEALAAEKTGKQAGLFVPSGTMGNLIAVLSHCGRGDEAIVGDLAHTFLYEAGGISALGGVHSRQIHNQPDGTLALEDIRAAIRSDDIHFPPSRLLTLENTHNRCGGVALSAEYTRAASDLAHEYGLAVHLDGARLFNAAAALGCSAADLAAPVDSVTFCLSKGLCAPVGSVLCGSADFIHQARRIRKQLGGGMRQAGILAAAGLIALEKMSTRLEEDHQRAQRLARALGHLPGIVLDPGTPHTNMVYLSLDTTVPAGARQIADDLRARGILIGVVGERRFRLVTHYWIDDQAVEATVAAFKVTLATLG
ncbi:MAG: low-specificity L-threonine aldolase [Anaerolineales bacterium]